MKKMMMTLALIGLCGPAFASAGGGTVDSDTRQAVMQIPGCEAKPDLCSRALSQDQRLKLKDIAAAQVDDDTFTHLMHSAPVSCPFETPDYVGTVYFKLKSSEIKSVDVCASSPTDGQVLKGQSICIGSEEFCK